MVVDADAETPFFGRGAAARAGLGAAGRALRADLRDRRAARRPDERWPPHRRGSRERAAAARRVAMKAGERANGSRSCRSGIASKSTSSSSAADRPVSPARSGCASSPRRPGRELAVMVIEKGGEIGNHGLSGAVVDPRSLLELFPGEDVSGGLDAPVSGDELWFLTRRREAAGAVRPAGARQPRQVRRLAQPARQMARREGRGRRRRRLSGLPGTGAACGTASASIGVRIGDKGIGADGQPQSNYEPGPDLWPRSTSSVRARAGRWPKRRSRSWVSTATAIPKSMRSASRSCGRCRPGASRAGHVVHTLGAPLPDRHLRRRLDLRDERRPDRHRSRRPDSTTPIPRPTRTTSSSR